MPILHHYALSAASRIVRLHLAEYEMEHELKTQLPWQRDEAFLALNPAGDLPVLAWPDGRQLAGARVICEWLEETAPAPRLMAGDAGQRAEIRRLYDWFEIKFTAETGAPLLRERVVKRFSSAAPVSSQTIRAALANSQIHLGYVNWLLETRSWLAGDAMSLADFAAAAHLSVLDYFGDISWDKYPEAKLWFMKMKSRPSYRSLLGDHLAGFPPAPHYAEVDF